MLTINILSLIYFVTAIFYLWLISFVLSKNPKKKINRICSLFLFSLAIWSIALMFAKASSASNTAMLWMNIASFGWGSFACFYLLFALIFTKNEKIIKKYLIYIIAFPIIIIIAQWNGLIIESAVKTAYGWNFIWSETIWTYLFEAYYLSFMIIGIYFCQNFKRKTRILYEKKQAEIIIVTTFIVLIIGTITNVILPMLKIFQIPRIANIVALIWGAGMVYAITRYKLMSPSGAARNIIAAMLDSLFLVDAEKNIIEVNHAALELLGYKEEEIIGKPVGILFEEEDTLFTGSKWDKLLKEGIGREYDKVCLTKTGERIPVSFSCSTMKDKNRNLTGVVCIVRDMREMKRLKQTEKDFVEVSATAKAEKKKADELDAVNQQIRASEQQLKAANQQLAAKEQALSSKMSEIEKFNKLMVGRELKMAEQKKEINSLLEQMKKPKKYEASDKEKR